VKHTLGGEVEIDYAPSGLVWALSCPAVNALDQLVAGTTAGTVGVKG
jgi:hypothetical protein